MSCKLKRGWAILGPCLAIATAFSLSGAGAAVAQTTKSLAGQDSVYLAALPYCFDHSISSGSIYRAPGGTLTWGTFNSGQSFTLSCYVYNVEYQNNRYYAETAPTYGSGKNQYGYIWVQRLYWGSGHQCWDGLDAFAIGSSECPLIDIQPTTPTATPTSSSGATAL